MLDSQYISNVKKTFEKHFQTIISNQRVDRHHIHIYVTNNTNDGLLDYLPAQLSNHADNDGYIEPIQPLIFRLSSSNGVHWDSIENNMYIHAVHFAGHQWLWNLNFRTDNAVSSKGKHQLVQDLKSKFHVDVNSVGLLSSSNDDLLKAFQHLISAMQYLRQNGEKYTVTAQELKNSAKKSLASKQADVKKAANAFKAAKKQKPRHRSRKTSRNKKSTRPVKQMNKTKKHNINASNLSNELTGKHVVLIGSLPHKKSYYTKQLKRLNCHIQQRVNGKTDYVICAKPGKSASYKAYKKNRIPNLIHYFDK